MAFIGSTTAYPTVTPAGADLVPIVRDSTGEVATATVASLIGSASEPMVALTGTSHSMLASYRSKLVTFSNASAVAASLPQAGVSFPDGWFFDGKNIGVGTVTITPTTSTIDGAASIALATGQSCRIVSDGTNYRTVLRSNGSPVPVADGGTGRTSHTAYAVLCGGTSSTAAQQSIASVGTAGQVLTSNGAGALPTFQAAAAAGSVATDAIWDAAGDLVQGTGANTAARLAIGTAHQIVRANSGATANAYADDTLTASPAFSATPTIDTTGAEVIYFGELTGNVTAFNLSGTRPKVIVVFKQDATGSRTVTAGSSIDFGTDIASLAGINSAANSYSYVGLVYHPTTTKFRVVAINK